MDLGGVMFRRIVCTILLEQVAVYVDHVKEHCFVRESRSYVMGRKQPLIDAAVIA